MIILILCSVAYANYTPPCEFSDYSGGCGFFCGYRGCGYLSKECLEGECEDIDYYYQIHTCQFIARISKVYYCKEDQENKGIQETNCNYEDLCNVATKEPCCPICDRGYCGYGLKYCLDDCEEISEIKIDCAKIYYYATPAGTETLYYCNSKTQEDDSATQDLESQENDLENDSESQEDEESASLFFVILLILAPAIIGGTVILKGIIAYRNAHPTWNPGVPVSNGVEGQQALRTNYEELFPVINYNVDFKYSQSTCTVCLEE